MALEDRIQWITQNEQTVMYTDYEGLSGADLIAVFDEGKRQFLEGFEKNNQTLSIMSNFKDAKISSDFIAGAKASAVEFDEKTERVGVIGMTGLQKIFYNGYIRFTGQSHKTKLFTSKEECLEWLTTEPVLN